MKQLLTLLTFLLSNCVYAASDTTIFFRQISYADLFEVAQKEGKGVMLYFHFDGCGACLKMEKTALKDKSVIDFCNTNFVNFEINTQNGDGIEINKIYSIQLHPTFIFFDKEGNELHKLAGVFSPEEFRRQLNDLLLSQRNLTNYKRRYNEGERAPDFLFDYIYMLRDAHELDSTLVNEYLDAIDPSDYALEKNIRFIYEFCVHNFKVFIPMDNPRFGFLTNNKKLFYKHFEINQVKTRIVWILVNAIHKAAEEKDERAFQQAIDLLTEYDNGERYLFKKMDGQVAGMVSGKNLVLSLSLGYYEMIGDKTNYVKTLDAFIATIWNDANELNTFAWGVFKEANNDEIEKINTAIKCAVRAIALTNNYANNDTYAWLLFKSGDKKKALAQADKAIEIAKKNNQDYSETQKLIALIKNQKKR